MSFVSPVPASGNAISTSSKQPLYGAAGALADCRKHTLQFRRRLGLTSVGAAYPSRVKRAHETRRFAPDSKRTWLMFSPPTKPSTSAGRTSATRSPRRAPGMMRASTLACVQPVTSPAT